MDVTGKHRFDFIRLVPESYDIQHRDHCKYKDLRKDIYSVLEYNPEKREKVREGIREGRRENVNRYTHTYTRPHEGYPQSRKTTQYTSTGKSLGEGEFGSIQEVCCEKNCSFAQKKQGTAKNYLSNMDNELIFFDEL